MRPGGGGSSPPRGGRRTQPIETEDARHASSSPPPAPRTIRGCAPILGAPIVPFPAPLLPRNLMPAFRLLGRISGVLIGGTVYPADGPGPPADVAAQRLDCPIHGRCRGCWVEIWPAQEEED